MSYRLLIWALLPAVIGLVTAGPGCVHAATTRAVRADDVAKGKPKPVRCKANQLRVTARGRVRCRTLPKLSDASGASLAALRAAIKRDPGTVRATGGRRIRSIWKVAGGRMRNVRARLLRALPRVAALVDGRAPASIPGDRRCVDGLPSQGGSIGGFSVTAGANGDVSMSTSAGGGYRIDVTLGGLVECSDIDLPACPTPDGKLDGRDGRGQTLGVRVTKDNALVQSLSTTVRSAQQLTGTVADDAKLDRIKVEDTARETISYQVPGVSLQLTIILVGTAEVDMRAGSIVPGSARVRVSAASTASAAAAGRAADDYARNLVQLANAEKENYRRRETAWQTPGTCAKLRFAAASDALGELEQGAQGTVTATVESTDGGVAAKARWTVSAVANGTIAPATAQGGGSAPFQYLVTRAGKDIKLSATFRATSTAGVAQDPWTQRTKEDETAFFYRIDGITYDASWSGGVSGSSVPCATTASVTETLSTSPLPYELPFSSLTSLDGHLRGAITSGSTAPSGPRTGTGNGCDLQQGGTPPPACSVSIGQAVPLALGVIIDLPPGQDAKVTWVLPPPTAGDGGPAFPCYTPTVIATPNPDVRTIPRSTFLDAGPQTISVTRNVAFNLDVPGLVQTLSGSSSATLTFHRVNEDGSPYTA